MSREGAVVAIVVTHNRRDLLEVSLAALLAQTRPADEIVVIDNASDDGTPQMLQERFPALRAVRLPENVGGAGGFHRALALAEREGFTWAWLMDDDTIPEPGALAALLDAGERAPQRPLVLSSRVGWTDGSLHPMNMPWPKGHDLADLVAAGDRGLVPLRACSFVSVLVHRDAIERHGLPHAHYFIWVDDLEYTARILRRDPGYWVPASRVEHRTKTAYSAPSSSGPRFYYDVRNRLFMLATRSWSPRERVTHAHHMAANVKHYLKGNRFSLDALTTVARGVRDGLRGPPR